MLRPLSLWSMLFVGCSRAQPDILPATDSVPVSTNAAPNPPSVPPTPSVSAPPVAPAPARPVGVVVTPTSWSFTASIHPSLPAFTFELVGKTRSVGAKVLVSATNPRDIPDPPGTFQCDPRCAHRELGPPEVIVRDGAGRVQALPRGYPAPRGGHPTEPQALELASTPVFGKNIGAGDLALADFDGDGHLDIEVVAARINNGHGKIYRYKQVWLFDPPTGTFRELVDAQGYSELALQSPGCLTSFELYAGSIESFYELRRGNLVHVATATGSYNLTEPREWRIVQKGSRCVRVGPDDRVSGG